MHINCKYSVFKQWSIHPTVYAALRKRVTFAYGHTPTCPASCIPIGWEEWTFLTGKHHKLYNVKHVDITLNAAHICLKVPNTKKINTNTKYVYCSLVMILQKAINNKPD